MKIIHIGEYSYFVTDDFGYQITTMKIKDLMLTEFTHNIPYNNSYGEIILKFRYMPSSFKSMNGIPREIKCLVLPITYIK